MTILSNIGKEDNVVRLASALFQGPPGYLLITYTDSHYTKKAHGLPNRGKKHKMYIENSWKQEKKI